MAEAEETATSAVQVPARPDKVRCPSCGKSFPPSRHRQQVCPNCGFRAATAPPDVRIMPEEVVGKPRLAAVAFALTWLLAFVFWPVYLYQTFRSLDRQHGRDHPIGWWAPSVIPLLGYFLAIPYAAISLRRLRRSRRARGLSRGLGLLWFSSLAVLTPLVAIGYAGWLQATPDRENAFDFAAEADMARLTDWGSYGATFVTEADWLANALLLLVMGLSPAVAMAWAVACANRLWRFIYDERGEAWPWREVVE